MKTKILTAIVAASLATAAQAADIRTVEQDETTYKEVIQDKQTGVIIKYTLKKDKDKDGQFEQQGTFEFYRTGEQSLAEVSIRLTVDETQVERTVRKMWDEQGKLTAATCSQKDLTTKIVEPIDNKTCKEYLQTVKYRKQKKQISAEDLRW